MFGYGTYLLTLVAPLVLFGAAASAYALGAARYAASVGLLRERLGRGPSAPRTDRAVAGAVGALALGAAALAAVGLRAPGEALVATPAGLAFGAVCWTVALVALAGCRPFLRAVGAVGALVRDRDRAAQRDALLAEQGSELVCHFAPNGAVVWVSPSVAAVLGYAPERLVGTSPRSLLHPEDAERVLREIAAALRTGAPAVFRIRHKDGTYRWMETVSRVLRDEAGASVGVHTVSRDVTERQEMEEELHHRSFHDPMTGLANRALLCHRLDALIEEDRASERPAYAVVSLHLDGFRAINERAGQAAGDEALLALAQRFRGRVPDAATLARVAGGTFAVLVPSDRAADVVELAAALRAAVAEGVEVEGEAFPLEASVGVVMGHPRHTDAGQALEEATVAAQEPGARDGVQLFTPSIFEARRRRERLESDLLGVALRDELRVVFQPLLSLADGRLTGFEALVRWDHPTLGLLYPESFIAIAEETGRIAEVDRWVLGEALRHADAWEEALGRPLDLAVSINCSARDLRVAGFAGVVAELLRGHPHAAKRCVLEITESQIVGDPERAAREMNALRQTGLRFALDDFGTGFSSLSTLHALPIDLLKVDKAFVRGMEADSGAAELVRTVLQLGDVMGATVLAEGIETQQQLDALRAMGCEFGQGYLFAHPLSARDAGRLVQLGDAVWDGHWTIGRRTQEAAGPRRLTEAL